MYKLNDGKIIDGETGEIISRNVSPKFAGWKYDDFYNEFIDNKQIRFLEPMTAKEIAQGESIPTKGYIAEEKLDGHRATMSITSKGNRFFSRRVSKKSNWYAENSDCLPHLRDFKLLSLTGTILDGELTMETFSDVQGVTGALPENALQKQVDCGFAVFNAFDILYYKGINIQAMSLWKRKMYLGKVIDEIGCPYIKRVRTYACADTSANYKDIVDEGVANFKDLLGKMWEEGKEGLIIKDLSARYEQKRSKHFLKLKNAVYKDVVIMGFKEPTKEYTGSELHSWEYWENEKPVTKPYYKGWIGSIECGVFRDGKLFKVAEAKGINDEQQEFIKENRVKLVENQVLEIIAQDIIDINTGSLRHPRVHRFREDKDPSSCKWEDYIVS